VPTTDAGKDGGKGVVAPLSKSDGDKSIPPDQFNAREFYKMHDNPNVKPEHIMDSFPPGTAAKIEAVEADLAKIAPTDHMRLKDGKWTPERTRLHADIIAD